MRDETWKLDATAQAELDPHARGILPLELVELAIRRIEALNPQINAVITPMFDRALQQAAGPLRRGTLPSPACHYCSRTPRSRSKALLITSGTRALRDAGYRSKRTTELARRFERAGFIFMGKTNVPELSADSTTEPSAFGPTRNPWDSRANGGRVERRFGSGGGRGDDRDRAWRGRHRIAAVPAACCGVATLKPSRGRVPSESAANQPDPGGVWSEFVLTRSVRDLAGVLDAVCRARPAERRFVAPSPVRPYVEELHDPGAARSGSALLDTRCDRWQP